MPFSALYDANVLYPFEIRDVLMVAARTGVFRALWSDDILDECARNLIKDGRATQDNMDRMFTVMKKLYPDATVTGYHHLIPSMTCALKDRHVLAAAVVGKAAVIVTYNRKDFPQASVEPHGIEIQDPDEFVRHVLDLAPGTFVDFFGDNAHRRHKPPVTPEEVAEHLRSGPMPISGVHIIELLKNEAIVMTEKPDVHGWYLRDRLRELSSNANLIPIILLTFGGFLSAFALGLIPIAGFPEKIIEIINQEFIEVNRHYDYAGITTDT